MCVCVCVSSKVIAEKEALELEKEAQRGTPYKPVADTKIDTKETRYVSPVQIVLWFGWCVLTPPIHV